MKKQLFIVSLIALVLASCWAEVNNETKQSTSPSTEKANTQGNNTAKQTVDTNTGNTSVIGGNPIPLAELQKNPKFLELQKKQEEYSKVIMGIKDPEYAKLRGEQGDIYQWKELWTEEMKKEEEEFKKIVANINNSGSTSKNDFWKIIEKRNVVMREFQTSQKFQDYLKSKQERLKTIEESIKQILPKEAVSIQEEIMALSKEIYQQPAK